MAITSVQWQDVYRNGSGYGTVDVNIAPSTVIAMINLTGTTGGGTQFAGIKHFRRRLPSGADQDVDFGEWPNWPDVIFERVSSVTFAVATGANQTGWALGRMDHWA
jgi:hypothetical protein